MTRMGFRPDRRGVSSVVGVVLLIGLMVVSVGIVGITVLGTDYFDPEPQADLVYDEDAAGNVGIAVEDARHMSADKTQIRLQGAGHCTDWEGSGDVEKGDVTITGFNDCPEQLEQGDVIQVIGNGRLVDTYELRGVYPDYGCDALDFEEKLESGATITIDDGDVVSCDLTGKDGGRIDNRVEILDGAELIGQVNTTEIEMDGGGYLKGNLDSEKTAELRVDWTIEGDLSIPSGAASSQVDIDDGVVRGSIQSTQDVTIDSDHEVTGDVIINGDGEDLDIRTGAVVGGNVRVDSDVNMYEDAKIIGDLVEGEIDRCDEGATVNGEDCEDYGGN